MTDAVEDIKAAIARLRQAGRDEGIEVDGPLGRWLEGQAEALGHLGLLLQDQDSRVADILGRIEQTAAVEFNKLHEMMSHADHVMKQGELALRQARQVQHQVAVERDHVVQKMVTQTLPMFLEKMKSVLVIRAQGEAAEARYRHLMLAGATAVALFLSGYVVSWCQDSGQLAVANQCVAAFDRIDANNSSGR